MMGWQALEQLEGPDGAVRADLEANSSGHYRYRVSRWFAAAPEDEGALGAGLWQVEEVSGLYDWRGTCRNDARRAIRLRSA